MLSVDGDADEARTTLVELAATDKFRHVPAVLFARAHLALDELDEAFRLADIVLETGELNAWGILTHPGWQKLQGHPDFAGGTRRTIFVLTAAIPGDRHCDLLGERRKRHLF